MDTSEEWPAPHAGPQQFALATSPPAVASPVPAGRPPSDRWGGLRVSTRAGAGVVTVTVAGELDVATIGVLRSCARDALATALAEVPGEGARRLVIECGGLSFIGAAGLGTLVAIQNLAARQDTSVLLTGVPPNMRRLVTLVGLDGHFAIADRLEP